MENLFSGNHRWVFLKSGGVFAATIAGGMIFGISILAGSVGGMASAGADRPAGAVALRVADGDTFTLAGEKVRVSNIDTPELFSPHCDAERRLARLARARLAQLLGDGSGVTLEREAKPDRYGRTLARVSVSGLDVGETLISDGLAAQWEGRRHNWCCQ